MLTMGTTHRHRRYPCIPSGRRRRHHFTSWWHYATAKEANE